MTYEKLVEEFLWATMLYQSNPTDAAAVGVIVAREKLLDAYYTLRDLITTE